MKRFYKTAEVVAGAGGYAIALDGKPVRTPLGASLALPNEALAEAVAAEWLAQSETLRPDAMVLTAIANTAIDRIGLQRAAIEAQLLRFGETDLLCYRADQQPELSARQHALWQPILDWAELRFGAALVTTTGIVPIVQPVQAMAALGEALLAYDQYRLAALSTAVAALGSLILGLALAEGRLTGAEAFALAQLEESFQNEQWGEDAEAALRRARLETEVEAAATVFGLHRP